MNCSACQFLLKENMSLYSRDQVFLTMSMHMNLCVYAVLAVGIAVLFIFWRGEIRK